MHVSYLRSQRQNIFPYIKGLKVSGHYHTANAFAGNDIKNVYPH